MGSREGGTAVTPPAAPLTALLLLKIVQYDFQAPLDPYKVIKNTETVKK